MAAWAAPAASGGAPGDFWLGLYGIEPWEWDIDHDGDGFTARDEYASGTDPFRPGSWLGVDIGNLDGEVVVSWQSLPGARYQLLGSPDLTSFSPLLDPITGDGSVIDVVPDPLDRVGFLALRTVLPGDADGDGLSAVEEGLLGTNPESEDTDGDGWLDGDEVCDYGTDPLVPDDPGGTLRGTLYNDPNYDGDLSDGLPLAGATVFLDADFDGRLDDGERTTTTEPDGSYQFLLVPAGIHHVRQELPAPHVQTFPAEALAPIYDRLPDELIDYTHAAPGVGDLDVPYGRAASDWPGNWGAIDLGGSEEVSPEVVLKPIGRRGSGVSNRLSKGSEFLGLPTGASVTVRFDEPIVDGPGPDFVVHPYVGGPDSEVADLFAGSDAGSLALLREIPEDGNPVLVDLADHGLRGPVYFLRVVGKDTGGAIKGYDLVGFEALNIAPQDPGAHVVTIRSEEVIEGLDFGRAFRDLEPALVLSATDGDPSTDGIRAGETLVVQASASDDVGIRTLEVRGNGQPLATDGGLATVSLPDAGKYYLEAEATDTGGQTVQKSVEVYVLKADGSEPFDPGLAGLSAPAPDAPRARILTPGPGFVSSEDVAIVAEIVGSPPATGWTVEVAPVDDIDPYNLIADDPDYQLLASGSGNIYSTAVATVPLSSLADGIYFLRLCARNSPERVACFGQVIAKNVPEGDLRPVVTIGSPASGSTVMVTAEITGTITSARPLREWSVEYAPADLVDLNDIGAADADWKRLAQGSGTVDELTVLATLDATMVKNNGYVVRVVAKNDIGLGRVEPILVEVAGGAKLGRNRIEFRDLSVELAGFPLQFVRVYDSIQAGEDGELGFGWSLDLQDADIRETVPETGALGLFGSTPFRDGTRVYITAPTGERMGFTFRPEPGPGSAFGSVYRAVFEPDPGVYHRLEIPEGNLPFLDLRPDGSVYLFFFGFPYNPSRYVLTDPDGNRYTYHESNGFLRAEDRNGNTITFSGDGIQHSAGPSLSFGRDPKGRITSVTDPAGGEWRYTYDAGGDLTGATDPDGRTTTYTYLGDPAHYLDGIIDPLGRQPVRYEYEPTSGRLLATIDEAGNRREASWDPAGFTGSVTDARGNVTQLEYDERGNVTREIDPLLNETFYEYGDPANPDLETAVTDARGERYESTYDDRGLLTRYRLPQVTGIAGANRMDVEYDGGGNVTRVRDFRNREWTFAYDAAGNVTEYHSPLGPDELNTYSPEGLLTGSTDGTGRGYATSYDYDSRGQFRGVRDTLEFRFEVELDGLGFPATATDGNGGSYAFEFDRRGVPVGQEDPTGTGKSVAELPDGSFVRTNRLGHADRFAFASDGLLSRYTAPDGGAVVPSYDPNRNLSSITDPLGNTTTYGYDALDRVNSVTDATGATMGASYNNVGGLAEITDRNGKRRTFEYDRNRRITAERWHDTAGAVVREIAFSYNGGTGNLDFVTDTQGETVHRLDFNGPSPRYSSVRFAYHGQDAWNVAYSWGESGDAAPFPTAVNVNKGALPHTAVRAGYFGGKPVDYSWTRPGSGGGGNEIEVRRNPDGTASSLRRFSGLGSGSPIIETVYGYDTLARLTMIRHQDAEGNLLHPNAEITYGRNAESLVSNISHAGDSASFTYDASGQLTSVDHTEPARPDESYTYDTNGNRTSSHLLPTPAVVGQANRTGSIGNFTYAYDAEGNVTRRTDTSTGVVTLFGYDHRNRLVEATVHPSSGAPASTTLRFEYDFLDRVISRESDGIKTWVLYDRSMPIGEFADGSGDLNAAFFYSLDKVDELHGVWREGLGERWFLNDHLGSVRGITDEDGALLSWVDYDAFGNLGAGAADGEPLRFAGRPFFGELGLYQNRRRFFDPVTGRFTQEDPVRLQGNDINLYRYAHNNPVNLTDPFGTTAALEQGLLDAYLALADTLCSFAECVGNLWSGVVKGVVNVETTDPAGDAGNCLRDMIPVPDWPPTLCDGLDVLKGQVEGKLDEGGEQAIDAVWRLLVGGPGGKSGAEATKKVKKIVDIIVKCGKATKIEIAEEKVGCSK